jgi:hypothetical protein
MWVIGRLRSLAITGKFRGSVLESRKPGRIPAQCYSLGSGKEVHKGHRPGATERAGDDAEE